MTTQLHPYQMRVIDEKADLDDKLEKLSAFMSSTPYYNLAVQERDRLNAQAVHMSRYSKVLGERIAAFA